MVDVSVSEVKDASGDDVSVTVVGVLGSDGLVYPATTLHPVPVTVVGGSTSTGTSTSSSVVAQGTGAAATAPWSFQLSNGSVVNSANAPLYASTVLTGNPTVTIGNLPATQAVTGTFWPATQPVSGNFYQAVQPVSGTVGINNFPSSQAVTGAFYQAVQPISGAITVTSGSISISNLPAVQAVSGVFWPANQPTTDTTLPDVFSGALTLASGTVGTAVTIATASGKATNRITISGLTASGATLTPMLSGLSTSAGFIAATVNTTPAGTTTTSITTDGVYVFRCAGSVAVQLAVTTAGSGNITINSVQSSAPDAMIISASALPIGAATAVNQVSNNTSVAATATNTGVLVTLAQGGSGADASGTPPTLLTLLSTFTVTQAGAFYVQNQSAGTIQVAFDNGTATPTIVLLGPGAGAGLQGGATDPWPWFTGRVRVLGATGAQFAARYK